MSAKVEYKLYRRTFADGAVYVGQTKHSPGNRGGYTQSVKLLQYFDSCMTYITELLLRTNSKKLIDEIERDTIQQYISEGRNVLNHKWSRLPNQYHCYICDLNLDESEFVADRRSYTGVRSGCKECWALLSMFNRHYKGIQPEDYKPIVKELSRSARG